jgi:tetratricopeptide (TPR) repeat protein
MRVTDKLNFIKNFVFTVIICCSLSLTASCQTKPQTTDEIIKPCQAFLDIEDLESASKCYQVLLFDNPTRTEEISKSSTSAIFQKCIELKAKNDYKKAIVCFEGITELMPNSANVQFNLADSYYEYFKKYGYKDADILGRAEEAVEKGLNIKSDDIAAIFLYGEILQSFGKLKEAKVQYKKLIEFDSKTSLYWSGLGLTQQKLDEDTEAIKSFEQAALLDPKNYLNYAFSAASYKKIGKFAKAIELLEKAVQLEPNDVEVKEDLNKLKEELKNDTTKKSKSKASGT